MCHAQMFTLQLSVNPTRCLIVICEFDQPYRIHTLTKLKFMLLLWTSHLHYYSNKNQFGTFYRKAPSFLASFISSSESYVGLLVTYFKSKCACSSIAVLGVYLSPGSPGDVLACPGSSAAVSPGSPGDSHRYSVGTSTWN